MCWNHSSWRPFKSSWRRMWLADFRWIQYLRLEDETLKSPAGLNWGQLCPVHFFSIVVSVMLLESPKLGENFYIRIYDTILLVPFIHLNECIISASENISLKTYCINFFQGFIFLIGMEQMKMNNLFGGIPQRNQRILMKRNKCKKVHLS